MSCIYKCSVCGFINTSCDVDFCTKCGADMGDNPDMSIPEPKEVLDPEEPI